MINIIFDNNLLSPALFTVAAGMLGYLFIKSYYNTPTIQTPDSPPTFNFSHEQIKEINTILDREEELNQETKDKLDEDFRNILGDDYANFQEEISEIENEFASSLQDIFQNFDNFM